nr:hypothetical protein [Sciscionella marina]
MRAHLLVSPHPVFLVCGQSRRDVGTVEAITEYPRVLDPQRGSGPDVRGHGVCRVAGEYDPATGPSRDFRHHGDLVAHDRVFRGGQDGLAQREPRSPVVQVRRLGEGFFLRIRGVFGGVAELSDHPAT